MPMVYPGPAVNLGGVSPALDALRRLGSASPASGMAPNPHRLTEGLRQPQVAPLKRKENPAYGLMTALPGPKLEG